MKVVKSDFKSFYKKNDLSELHNIHSYTAKLIPHIPKYIVETYSEQDNLILDPFCGSGTTLVEAVTAKRITIGMDINPLAILISNVKVANYDLIELESAIKEVNSLINKKRIYNHINFPNINYWFSRKAKKELNVIINAIDKISNKFSDEVISFLLICFSSIIRKSSFADPKISKVYKSKFVIQKIEDGWKPTPLLFFSENCDKYYNILKNSSQKFKKTKLFCKDISQIKTTLKNYESKIDLIITSPPYICAQDYYRTFKLEVLWCNLLNSQNYSLLKKFFLGNEFVNSRVRTEINLNNKVYKNITKRISAIDEKKGTVVLDFFSRMEKFIIDSHHMLKPNGKLCLITGNSNICGIKIPTFKILNKIAEENNFSLKKIYSDEIKSRNLFKNRNHDGGHIKEEFVSILEARK